MRNRQRRHRVRQYLLKQSSGGRCSPDCITDQDFSTVVNGSLEKGLGDQPSTLVRWASSG